MIAKSRLFFASAVLAFFFAACSDDSSSSVNPILLPPADESFNAAAVEDSTGAEIDLTAMGTSFKCDRVTEDSSLVVSNVLSGQVDAWTASMGITVEISFKENTDAAKKVVEAVNKEYSFSESEFPADGGEDSDQVLFRGTKTISMSLQKLPEYIMSHCDTSKAKKSGSDKSESEKSED
ncbi:hypothetical protein [Fibrobacter sp. UBA4309]|jgi:hypothetical protein|uniref:hypothetical protein n=1 Tax=Fibrobacter sp. UBA4309 TaxID=1946537 RepID=UPI0025BF1D4B|nr:hypothetical protein [Fibrobacter sp. UBA4309]